MSKVYSHKFGNGNNPTVGQVSASVYKKRLQGILEQVQLEQGFILQIITAVKLDAFNIFAML